MGIKDRRYGCRESTIGFVFFFSKNDLTALGADKNYTRLSGRDKVCARMGGT